MLFISSGNVFFVVVVVLLLAVKEIGAAAVYKITQAALIVSNF